MNIFLKSVESDYYLFNIYLPTPQFTTLSSPWAILPHWHSLPTVLCFVRTFIPPTFVKINSFCTWGMEENEITYIHWIKPQSKTYLLREEKVVLSQQTEHPTAFCILREELELLAPPLLQRMIDWGDIWYLIWGFVSLPPPLFFFLSLSMH